MKVYKEDLDAVMELKTKGILLSVYDNDGTYRGKLRVGRARIEWCRGRTQLGNGVTKSWNDLISFFDD